MTASRQGRGARAPVAIDADGQATALRGVGAMVLDADCLPVALGAERRRRDASHAGWRGLAGGVLEEGVRALRELGGERASSPRSIGPGAGGCCYEVGEEVHERFGGAPPRAARLHRPARRSRASGCTPPASREVQRRRACTICDERFFSHRREGARAGRQAGVAWLS